MPNPLPLMPAALLGGAALACLWPSEAHRLRTLAAAAGAAAALMASAGLFALVSRGGAPGRLALGGWPGAVFSAPPVAEVDLASGLCLILLTATALLAVLRSASSPAAPDVVGRGLLVASAGAAMVTMALSPLGLVLSWALLDALLFLAAAGQRRGLLAGQLGLLLAVIGLSTLPADTLATGVASSRAGAGAAGWLFVAGAIRMGIFPIPWAVPAARRRHLWASGLVRLAPTIAGARLVIEAGRIGPAPGGFTGGLALPMVAVLVGGVLAGTGRHYGRALDWSTTHQGGLILVAAGLGGVVGEAVSMLLLVDLVLGRAGAYLVPRSPRARGGTLAHGVMAAALAGLPPTLGFAARWHLYRELLFRHGVAWLGVVAVGTAFAIAGVHRLRGATASPGAAPDGGGVVRPPPVAGVPARGAAMAALVAAGLQVALGLGFSVAYAPLAASSRAPLPNPFIDMVATVRQTPAAAVIVAAMFLPVLLAAALTRILAAAEEDGAATTRGWDVKGAAASAAEARTWLGGLVGRLSGLVEGRRAMAWTLLAAAAIGLVPMSSPGAETPPAEWAHALAFGSAALLGAGLVLATSSATTLVVLGAAYPLSAGILVLGGGALHVAAIKVLAGVFAATILALGAAQAPAERSLAAARRLRSLRGETVSGRRLVPLLALAVFLAAAYGVSPVAAADEVPVAILAPALALVAGGIIAAVVAATPLALSAAVLFSLAGFELAYARLDPGLVVTGALAGFQLLFALLASYFVALAPPQGPEP